MVLVKYGLAVLVAAVAGCASPTTVLVDVSSIDGSDPNALAVSVYDPFHALVRARPGDDVGRHRPGPLVVARPLAVPCGAVVRHGINVLVHSSAA